MVQGLNSNISLNDVVYHVQTQDLGGGNAQVVTMIYRGGAIISSRSTDYSEWADMADREARVRELVAHQHREMIDALRSGEIRGTGDKV